MRIVALELVSIEGTVMLVTRNGRWNSPS